MNVAALAVWALLTPAAVTGQDANRAPAPSEVIATVQIHGNNVTPDAEVLALAGVSPGDPFGPATMNDVRQRLLRSGRFEGVEVRKRFASIDDPSRIAIVIVVDEHPVRIVMPDVSEEEAPDAPPRVLRRGVLRNAMWLPILDVEEGYGVTYGAVVAYPGVTGNGSRMAFPLSWGGRKRAAAEIDHGMARGPIGRIRVGASIERRRNPVFDERDDRRRVWGRVERAVTRDVRVGATAAWEHVTFADEGDRFRSIGADATLDTRLDPGLPRNAVYAHAAWTRMAGDRTGRVDRTLADARGYLGMVGQSVLVARVERDAASRPLPRYFKPMLGGWSTLRGFAAGSFAGDTRVTGSLELRVPVSSPLSVAKAGFSVFVDAGKVYDHGTRFDAAPLRTGAGAGVWLSATIVQAGVAVAHGRGSGTRVHVGVGLTF